MGKKSKMRYLAKEMVKKKIYCSQKLPFWLFGNFWMQEIAFLPISWGKQWILRLFGNFLPQ